MGELAVSLEDEVLGVRASADQSNELLLGGQIVL